MIVPWIKGFLDWTKAPLTWTLLLLNFLVFFYTFQPGQPSPSHKFSKAENLVLTGKLYHQFLHPDLKKMPLKTQSEWMLLGSRALKQATFINQVETFSFSGDEIAIANWRADMKDYKKQMSIRPTYTLGLHSKSRSALNWVTYQFMHAGWMHLLGNMLMLAIFAGALEFAIGGLMTSAVYVLGGIAGAASYLYFSHDTLAPMIGASGSLSAVMAFYAAYEKKKRVSFFYFLSPLPGYYGWIYLPTILIFPLCFLSDFAGLLGTSQEVGTGVAYAAHLGGAVFGAFSGWALRFFRKNLWVRWISQH